MNIAILSRDANIYSTFRLVQEGRERGHNIFVIDHMLCNLVIENNRPKVYFKGVEVKNIDLIIPRIGANVTDFGASVIQHFESMGVLTLLSSESLMNSRNKIKSLQLLIKEGIAIPNTCYINSLTDLPIIEKTIGKPPWIIKIPEGTQGIGVILCESIASAESTIEALTKLNTNVIAQEFIKESKATDIRIFIVDGQILGAMKRSASTGFRSNLHRGATGEPIELTNKEKRQALEAVKALNLNVAGVDLLQSNKGPLIMEVNSSPGLEGIEKNTSVNVAKEIIIASENLTKEQLPLKKST